MKGVVAAFISCDGVEGEAKELRGVWGGGRECAGSGGAVGVRADGTRALWEVAYENGSLNVPLIDDTISRRPLRAAESSRTLAPASMINQTVKQFYI